MKTASISVMQANSNKEMKSSSATWSEWSQTFLHSKLNSSLVLKKSQTNGKLKTSSLSKPIKKPDLKLEGVLCMMRLLEVSPVGIGSMEHYNTC